jgi:RNA-binding protein
MYPSLAARTNLETPEQAPGFELRAYRQAPRSMGQSNETACVQAHSLKPDYNHGMSPPLTARERSALKARAHALEPVVQIGQSGLTDSVVHETERALAAHHLIKVRIGGIDRVERDRLAQDLASRVDAAVVQQVGRVVVLWRPPDEDAR